MNKLANLIRTVGQKNSKGGQDSVLAHITPRESELLKLLGGSGRTDPDTGALHFDDSSMSGDGYSGGGSTDADDPGSPSYSGPDDGGPSDPSVDNSNPFAANEQGPGVEAGGDAWTDGSIDAGLTGPSVDNSNPFAEAEQGSGTAPGGDAWSDGSIDSGLTGSGSGSAYANIDEDGSGKGRSGSAFGKGGELEGFGTWSQEVGGHIGSYGWDADKSNAWMAGLLGYDPGKTTMQDVGNMLGLNDTRAGVAGQAVNNVAGGRTSATEDDMPNEDAMSGGMGVAGTHSAFSTGTAGQAGNAVASNGAGLGGRGDTFDNVTTAYEDSPFSWNAENNQGGGFGGYANQALVEAKDFVTAHPNITSAINLGLGLVNPMAGLVANSLTNAAKGNYAPGATALAGILGGPAYAQVANVAGNLFNGTPGNMVAGYGANYLDSISPGLGQLANISGVTGMGARGLNDAYSMALNDIQSANVDGDLSSESTGSADTPSESFASADTGDAGTSSLAAILGDSPAPGINVAGGGGGPGDMSDYDSMRKAFLGSRKKSRYRANNSLMALLGEDYAA